MAVGEVERPVDFVDADGHVIEPPFALPDYAPAAFRDHVYHLEIDADGAEWVVVGDQRMAAGPFALGVTGGLSDDDRDRARKGEVKFSEVATGGWDATVRLADMDTDRIWSAVLYPTLLLGFQSQHPADLVVAQCQAYNNWLADHVQEGHGRLFGALLVPQRDPVAAAAEIRRAARLPGMVGIQVRPNPAVGWKPFNDPAYDPIWAAVCDVGLPIGLHPLMSSDLPGAVRGMHLAQPTAAEPVPETVEATIDNLLFTNMIGNPFDMMYSLTFLVAGGVLSRFPELRIAFLEATGGWIVPWLERLDHQARTFSWDAPWLEEEPSALFRRQCWISFDADESTIEFTARSPIVGADRILWASDYPHPDAKIPGVTKDLEASIAGLDDDDQARIAGGNARALYGI